MGMTEPGGARWLAISTDPNDRNVYAGPNTAPAPAAPAGRVWIEEYRALTGGYSTLPGYTPEPWADSGAVTQGPPPAVRAIEDRLREHLARSTELLRTLGDNPTLTAAQVVTALVRHERALNLIVRVLLEVFEELPESVSRSVKQ